MHISHALLLLFLAVTTTAAGNCTDGSLRLQNGTSALSGGVELCLNNAWGTICDQGFGTADATVICQQLGFANTSKRRKGRGHSEHIDQHGLYSLGTDATALRGAAFGRGIGPIFMEFLACSGSETSILSCTSYLQHTCDHSRDVGVICQGKKVRPCSKCGDSAHSRVK